MTKTERRIINLFKADIIEEETARQILAGDIKIANLPPLSKVGGLSHRRLIRVLCYCPESPRFYESKTTLNMETLPKKEARKVVQKLVLDFLLLDADEIKEANYSQEMASLFQNEDRNEEPREVKKPDSLD